jgi:hypothetical protein
MRTPLVGDVYKLLGRDGKHPVLLHINGKEKGPKWLGWQKISYGETMESRYQKLLHQKANTGVRLGDDDLCTIDCDTDPFLQEMFRLNPKLRETFCSCGEQGGQIWGYFPGERPRQVHPLKVHKDSPLAVGLKDPKPDKDDMVAIGEWRAEGGQSVILGIHPCGRPYTWLNGPVVPKQFNFQELIWHGDIAIPWEERPSKGSAYNGSSAADDSLLKRAIAQVTVERLWDHFGYPERNGNPVCSPFREDKHPSFSIYDQGRRFKDHGASWSEHRGDSFDFYQLATKQAAKTAFKAFVELAGLGHELSNIRSNEDPEWARKERAEAEKKRPKRPSPLYLSLAAEIEAADQRPLTETLIEPTWTMRLPTTLTMLRTNTPVFPAYVSTATYIIGSVVTSKGVVYMANQTPYQPGETYSSGAVVSYADVSYVSSQAAYAVATTYGLGDVVILGGKTYTSLQSGNTGNQPDVSPTWWKVTPNAGNEPDSNPEWWVATPNVGYEPSANPAWWKPSDPSLPSWTLDSYMNVVAAN